MDDIHRITIQLRAPKGNDPGKVAIGHYVVNPDNYVVLCDENGKPTGDEKHHLDAAGDAKLIACGMLRRRQNARSSSGDFSRPISYPKIGY
ncbi:MAG: hypothetical protein WAV38_32540 [Xanthobacteraceae bacterium]